jgi:autoinducer 2-degrading protein
MHVIIVHIHVKPEFVDAFIEATKANAANSLKEVDIKQFDFYRQKDDPNRFTLVEVYTRPEGHALHRETAHYQTWRDAVADMMAEPRQGISYTVA